jgi:hypothetical protein
VGGAAVIHGADGASAGLVELFTGEEAQTFTQQAISSSLQMTGVSKGKADLAGLFADASLSIALSGGAARLNAMSDVTRVASNTSNAMLANINKRDGEWTGLLARIQATRGCAANGLFSSPFTSAFLESAFEIHTETYFENSIFGKKDFMTMGIETAAGTFFNWAR